MTEKRDAPRQEDAPITNTASTVPQVAERVFANSYQGYVTAGWPGVIPIPPGPEKAPPPEGFTGDYGIDTDPKRLAGWAANGKGQYEIALRVPRVVLGLDVDDYIKAGKAKTGATTLAECETKWGPLPPTWCSTARGGDDGPGPSHIRVYRVPPIRYIKNLPSLEIIQWRHRYMLVAPSRHAVVGKPYRWYRPDGTPAGPDEVPRPDDLPELPAAWVEGLREGAAEAGPASAGYAEGEAMRAALLVDDREPCAEVANALDQAELRLSDEEGSRHDSMLAPSMRLVMLGAAGHPGVGQALERLAERWGEMTGGEDREAEFDRMVLDAARKAVTEVGQATPVAWDPCLVMAGGTPTVMPVPGVEGVAVAEPPQPHPWLTWIGAHPFDPKGGTDQALARAVLERVRPMLRFATGTKGGWLLRGPTCWELDEDLTGRAITEVAELMPRGEAAPPSRKKDKYTDENWTAWRRAEFMSSAGSGRIERKIRSAVAGGMHPSAVKLAGLDADLEVLWAGGWPWDLRASYWQPTIRADVDPATPHLHTALVAPDATCPTPRWNAFVAVVWPDPAIRAWALRVLSVALTGYPDAVLPVLYGRERSGKTSVVEILVEVLGSYAHAASAKLLSSQDNAHPEIYWDLKGRRLSFIDEGPKRGHDATERLKQITGGGSLTGRAMQKNSVTFKPSHTLVMTTNDEPQLTDPALRARIRLIPCDAAESGVRPARIALLGAALTAEAPGILAAMMREAAGYLANLDSASTAAAPTGIRGLALELAQAQDPAWEWVDNCTVAADPGTPGRVLYTSFCKWHQDSPVFRKLPMPTENAFGRSLTAKAILPKKTGGLSYRPLSVLAGAVGLAPWEPITEPYMTRGASPAPAGEDLGSIAGTIGQESSRT